MGCLKYFELVGSLEDFMEKQENKEKGHFKEYVRAIKDQIMNSKISYKWGYQYTELPPIQRLGQPEDVASIVSFLASKYASFITGVSFTLKLLCLL